MSGKYKGFFQAWEISIAKKLVKEFQEKWTCLKREGFDDLLQECLAHWYFSRDGYCSGGEASQQTFMGRIVRNKLTDLVRDREADKRKVTRLTISLDAPSEDGEHLQTLIEKIDSEKALDTPLNPFLEINLQIDLKKAFQKLNLQQKKLCHLLGQDELTVQEASKNINTPRSTVYDELERIRKIFLKEGLKEYLK
jgi:RNA polymerase sigma-70 factor (ECF subfamily)